MIFKSRFSRHPPQNRIDGVIYYGAKPTMSDRIFYAADLDTGLQIVVPEDEMPASPPTGAAGGGLGGTYPNPTVVAVPDSALSPNVPVMTAGFLPPVNGSLLTGIPGPAGLAGGVGTLDGVGQDTLTFAGDLPNVVVVSFNSGPAVGPLSAAQTGIGIWTVASAVGAADAGQTYCWISLQ